LKGATLTPAQGVEWLHSKGYNATIIDRPLNTTEIKKRLDNSEPIVTVLQNQNTADWLDSTYAGVLYAHDDVETGTAEGKLHASFIKTVNYGEAQIADGTEAQAFQFPELKNTPDPVQANSSFKWVSTITGIKRDPSWENAQTINGDKAKGIFQYKLTKAKGQSQVDFTDPNVTALLNKYPIGNKDQTAKLAAVSLINLYEDDAHQKTIKDLEQYLKIAPSTCVTSQQIVNWYKYLGFDFDIYKGRAPMNLTMAINNTGRLYLTLFKAKDAKNKVQTTAGLGTGYLNNSFNGYRPYWSTVKMGENLIPYYDVPLNQAGLKKQQALAKQFKYTNVQKVVSSPFSKTTYDEDMTLYNIRLKGTPNDSGITVKPTQSVTTPPVTSNVKPTTNAAYNKAPSFNIRETQGQEMWCSEYVNAGAINTVCQAPVTEAEDKGAVTTARKLMELNRPGIPYDKLKDLTGTTVADLITLMQQNYNITTDFEMRPLSFAEVKREIDAGGIVQMDGNNSESTDAPGTGDNLGHSVAIVGYVMPTSGNQAPYYIVWNPWWDNTFYLSSQAKTYNLGGVNYKWTRTWHNWRRISKARSRIAVPVDSSLKDQKVMGTSNPYAFQQQKDYSLDLGLQGSFAQSLRYFGTNKDDLNQSVYRYGKETKILDALKGFEYGYSIGVLGTSGDGNVRVRRNLEPPKIRRYCQAVKDFQDGVDSLIATRNGFKWYVGGIAIIVPLLVIANAVPIVGVVADVIAGFIGAGTLALTGGSVGALAKLIVDYVKASNSLAVSYNKL
uniref:C47 family peptidase n=1 Tax=Lactococcus garvieae TaxID=1363 RepID=UPI00359CB317